MTIGLTYKELSALRPCRDEKKRVAALFGGAKKWGRRSISAAEAREAGATFDDLIWASAAMASRNPEIERRLRLWVADCAAHVNHIHEARSDSGAPRREIVATSRQFARGKIDAAARAAARAAVWAAAGTAWAPDEAAWAAAEAAGQNAWDAEQGWQFDRLIARLSDPEPEDWPLPEVKKAVAA